MTDDTSKAGPPQVKAHPEKAPDEVAIDTRQLARLGLELSPLIAFFLVYRFYDIFAATGATMAVTLVTLGILYRMLGRLPLMPVISCALLTVFGTLTLWLHDPLFVKLKVTILYGLFAAVLFGGLAMGRPLLKYVLGETIRLKDEGWRVLTVRWGLFFLVLAGMNEIVRLFFSEPVWVNFKIFGVTALLVIFSLAQGGVMERYRD